MGRALARARGGAPRPWRRGCLALAALLLTLAHGLAAAQDWQAADGGVGAPSDAQDSAALPAPAESGDPLPERFAQLLPELSLHADQVSIFVQQVDEPVPRLAVNAWVPRIPASVMKLFTSIAALDLLGPDHRWSTAIYSTGEQRDGVLYGDLFIRGYGDPYLTNDAYAGLIRALRERGLQRIAGDLVFDGSLLAPPDGDRDSFDGAGASPYNALPAALSLNRQVTDIVVHADRAGGRVGVYTEPPLSGVDLVADAVLVPGPCEPPRHRIGVTVTEPAGARPVIRVTGNFASDCPEERFGRLLFTPEQHAASAFHALWGQLGGQIDGRVRLGDIPPDAVLVTQVQSRTLGELVRDVNKLSNNLSARMVFLALGVEASGPPGTTEASRAAVADWLAANGFDFPELFVDNGSGLSRQTRIAAGSLGELLVWAWHRPWMPELVASLPIVGVDGTMARRMRLEPIAGRAHIKTGTVRDASCIAGYVLDAEGQRWAVVVLVNARPGGLLPAWAGHAIHHEVLRWVYEGAVD